MWEGGYSLPIVFNLSGKIPEDELIITGNAECFDSNGVAMKSPYVEFETNRKSYSYSEQSEINSIYFVVKAISNSNSNSVNQ